MGNSLTTVIGLVIYPSLSLGVPLYPLLKTTSTSSTTNLLSRSARTRCPGLQMPWRKVVPDIEASSAVATGGARICVLLSTREFWPSPTAHPTRANLEVSHISVDIHLDSLTYRGTTAQLTLSANPVPRPPAIVRI